MRTRSAGVSVFWLMLIRHLYRQWFNPGNSIDLSGPLMVITQKVTSFAWDLWDGRNRKQGRANALTRFPSPLEFLGFIFFFPGYLAGPALELKPYIDGINTEPQESSMPRLTPRDTFQPAIIRLFYGGFFAAYHIVISDLFPAQYCLTQDFLSWTIDPITLLYRCVYFYLALQGFKAKFYFVWLVSEGACIAMGYGAYPSPPHSTTHSLLKTEVGDTLMEWDGMSNVSISKIELATSFVDITRYWNKRTHLWLKQYIYKRVMDYSMRLQVAESKKTDETVLLERKHEQPPRTRPNSNWLTIATFAVYVVSAFWHGFYPGYYLTFLTGALINIAERSWNQVWWPYLSSNTFSFYHSTSLMTGVYWIGAQWILAYSTMPFIILDFVTSLRVWSSVHFAGQVCLVSLIVSARILKRMIKNRR